MKPATGIWQLKPLNSPDLPALIDLTEAGLTLGRDAANSVVFSHERYPHVSSFHARVSLVDGAPVVEDLGSSNGSLVNGRDTRSATLKAGDVLQLGRRVGPRLLVVNRTSATDMAATVNIGEEVRPREGFGATTILNLKQALGLPAGEVQLHTLLRTRSRRLGLWLTLLFILLVGGFVAGAYYVSALRDRDIAQVEGLNRELQTRLELARRELRSRMERSQEELRVHRETWERDTLRLEAERTALQSRLDSLESEERSAAEEIAGLRKRLAETSEQLRRYKPVDLSQEERIRQSILEETLRAVVYIEKRIVFRDRQRGALLHGTETDVGWTDVNLDGRGEPYYEEGGGSGFCISPEGYIVTNAHVVGGKAAEDAADLGALGLEPQVRLAAVFSGGSEKLPLEVVKVAESDIDLALARVQPFDGMPYLRGFHGDPADVPLARPAPGNQVRLFGFPFGKYIPQEGDTLSASVFAGIISRKVGKYIQVHAAIYPGGSGGPVVDVEGRLVGVVTSVQTLPSGQIASDIGFVVPGEQLSAIWPHRS